MYEELARGIDAGTASPSLADRCPVAGHCVDLVIGYVTIVDPVRASRLDCEALTDLVTNWRRAGRPPGSRGRVTNPKERVGSAPEARANSGMIVPATSTTEREMHRAMRDTRRSGLCVPVALAWSLLWTTPGQFPRPWPRRRIPSPRPGGKILRAAGGGVVLRRRRPPTPPMLPGAPRNDDRARLTGNGSARRFRATRGR
jgi:hypothetical protein